MLHKLTIALATAAIAIGAAALPAGPAAAFKGGGGGGVHMGHIGGGGSWHSPGGGWSGGNRWGGGGNLGGGGAYKNWGNNGYKNNSLPGYGPNNFKSYNNNNAARTNPQNWPGAKRYQQYGVKGNYGGKGGYSAGKGIGDRRVTNGGKYAWFGGHRHHGRRIFGFIPGYGNGYYWYYDDCWVWTDYGWIDMCGYTDAPFPY